MPGECRKCKDRIGDKEVHHVKMSQLRLHALLILLGIVTLQELTPSLFSCSTCCHFVVDQTRGIVHRFLDQARLVYQAEFEAVNSL
jgi:hypothetical protein